MIGWLWVLALLVVGGLAYQWAATVPKELKEPARQARLDTVRLDSSAVDYSADVEEKDVAPRSSTAVDAFDAFDDVSLLVKPKRRPARPDGKRAKGLLVVHAWPWARVIIDGTNYGTTPLAPITLPVGRHTVVLLNSELGTKRRRIVRVWRDRKASLKVRMDR